MNQHSEIPKRKRRARRWALASLLALILVAVSGCRTFSFYAQAFKGQYQIITSEERTDKLLANGATSAALRKRLELLEELRAFAARELKLPVDGQYTKYADVHRPCVVLNVEAAPEF